MFAYRLSEQGVKFAVVTMGAAAIAGGEYYLYYHCLRDYTAQLFRTTALADLAEYADEVLIDTGKLRFVFKHRGGSTAVASVLRDTFENSRFAQSLALQLLSAVCMAIGSAKQRPAQAVIAFGLLASNLLTTYPPLNSGFNLLRLGVMVNEGNKEVYANLNETRLTQRLEETVPAVRMAEKAGLVATLAICGFCGPVLTLLAAGSAYGYWYRPDLGRKQIG